MGIIAKQSIKGTIVTYIGVAIGFLTTFFVLTRFLSAEEIGLARVLIDASTLFVGLAQLGTSASIIRFFPYFKDSTSRGHHGFYFWCMMVPLVGLLVFSLIYWACSAPLGQWFAEKSPLIVDYYYAVIPLAAFMLYQSVFETASNVQMRIVFPKLVREVLVRIGMLVCYLCYAFQWLTMNGFVTAICLNYLVAATIDLIYLLRSGEITLRPDWQFLQTNRPLVHKYLRYTLFLFVGAITTVLAPVLSSFFLTAKMGLNYTGIFAIATYMAVLVSIPYRSLTAIASPQLADAIKQEDQSATARLLQQVTTNMLLVGCLIFLLIWVNIDLIFTILPNGETYAVGRQAVFFLGISQLIIATCNISLSALNYSRYYAISLIFSCMLTIGAILLNQWLIPLWGINGAAISNLLAYAGYFLLIVLTVCLLMKTSPLNRQQIVCTLGFVLVLVLNHWSAEWLAQYNIWISSILRCGWILIYAGLMFHFTVSPEINALLRSFFVSRH